MSFPLFHQAQEVITQIRISTEAAQDQTRHVPLTDVRPVSSFHSARATDLADFLHDGVDEHPIA